MLVFDYFHSLLQKYFQIDKIGFGLRIDDLPEHYMHKEVVLNRGWKLRQLEIASGVWWMIRL